MTPRVTGTGDLGYTDDRGRIDIVGRSKELLLLRDGRIAPELIEDRLLGHPLIEDCGIAVIDTEDGWDRLGICVVAKRAGATREIEAMLADFEPSFSRVEFVASIPRTPLGKPNRRRLWSRLTAPDADAMEAPNAL
jgi:acyl-CoA synthetase (AMP-forming)/AMP-acid ligase II